MNDKRKTVFISYSWDGPEHQEWVLNLAKDLMEKFGVNVILDQFELSAGKDLTYFMESSIEKADKVLVILTPNYKQKAESRKSGVGYETSMITQEIFESPISRVKFIPILRVGSLNDSTPKFLKSKLYHEMNDYSSYISKLYELSRIIYDKSLVEKPKLGKIPDFSTNQSDPVIDIANAVLSEESLNQEINSILNSFEGAKLYQFQVQFLNTQLKEKAELYNSSTSIPFTFGTNNRDSSIVQALGYSVSFYWGLKYSNTAENSILTVRYWKGYLNLNDNFYFPGEEPKRIKEIKYSLDMNYEKTVLWRSGDAKMLTNEIIQEAFLFIIDSIKKEKSKTFRS